MSPLVIVDSSVSLKMSTITRESTISREMQAKIDSWSTEQIHYNERFHYYEIHYYQRRLYLKVMKQRKVIFKAVNDNLGLKFWKSHKPSHYAKMDLNKKFGAMH